ncbi:unnamed protein product (macronuclear) [Paramecium tetraurelia]|uniref:Uncharacterized protein n=1 Tax=Paramecium tetraurelia TaxID=5888 RepID=A0DYK3_PARTE|nr:uncharacterized protein GSPATT00003088001 [Paramecium tetraurelia]CAK88120.1 unnamed protein product [Paramecium tetraurelia]
MLKLQRLLVVLMMFKYNFQLFSNSISRQFLIISLQYSNKF